MESKNFNYIVLGLLVLILIVSVMPRKQRQTEAGTSYSLPNLKDFQKPQEEEKES